MNTDLFSIREKEIFHALKALAQCDFVIIGGYAVNAYTLPRFSVDCDIVVKDSDQLKEIEKILVNLGYIKEESGEVRYSGRFLRYEKKLPNNLLVSMDILFQGVTDRLTGVTFGADWVFAYSKSSILRGKTITEKLNVRIINRDALLVMKMIACRATDIRDVFMMLPDAQDKEWIKAEVAKRYNIDMKLGKIIEKVMSKQFKDGLSGVYGYVDEKTFGRHKKAVLSLQESIK